MRLTFDNYVCVLVTSVPAMAIFVVFIFCSKGRSIKMGKMTTPIVSVHQDNNAGLLVKVHIPCQPATQSGMPSQQQVCQANYNTACTETHCPIPGPMHTTQQDSIDNATHDANDSPPPDKIRKVVPKGLVAHKCSKMICEAYPYTFSTKFPLELRKTTLSTLESLLVHLEDQQQLICGHRETATIEHPRTIAELDKSITTLANVFVLCIVTPMPTKRFEDISYNFLLECLQNVQVGETLCITVPQMPEPQYFALPILQQFRYGECVSSEVCQQTKLQVDDLKNAIWWKAHHMSKNNINWQFAPCDTQQKATSIDKRVVDCPRSMFHEDRDNSTITIPDMSPGERRYVIFVNNANNNQYIINQALEHMRESDHLYVLNSTKTGLHPVGNQMFPPTPFDDTLDQLHTVVDVDTGNAISCPVNHHAMHEVYAIFESGKLLDWNTEVTRLSKIIQTLGPASRWAHYITISNKVIATTSL